MKQPFLRAIAEAAIFLLMTYVVLSLTACALGAFLGHHGPIAWLGMAVVDGMAILCASNMIGISAALADAAMSPFRLRR